MLSEFRPAVTKCNPLPASSGCPSHFRPFAAREGAPARLLSHRSNLIATISLLVTSVASKISPKAPGFAYPHVHEMAREAIADTDAGTGVHTHAGTWAAHMQENGQASSEVGGSLRAGPGKSRFRAPWPIFFVRRQRLLIITLRSSLLLCCTHTVNAHIGSFGVGKGGACAAG